MSSIWLLVFLGTGTDRGNKSMVPVNKISNKYIFRMVGGDVTVAWMDHRSVGVI